MPDMKFKLAVERVIERNQSTKAPSSSEAPGTQLQRRQRTRIDWRQSRACHPGQRPSLRFLRLKLGDSRVRLEHGGWAFCNERACEGEQIEAGFGRLNKDSWHDRNLLNRKTRENGFSSWTIMPWCGLALRS